MDHTLSLSRSLSVASDFNIPTPRSQSTFGSSTLRLETKSSSNNSPIASPSEIYETVSYNSSEISSTFGRGMSGTINTPAIANIASIYNFPGVSSLGYGGLGRVSKNSNEEGSFGNRSVVNADPKAPGGSMASYMISGSTYIPSSKEIPIIPIENYQLNFDPNPTIIKKKPTQRVQHTQNVSLKYLKPPLPPPAGDITITQEQDVQLPPAPPLHVTQKPPAPLTPGPVIVRERPPKPPAPIGPKNIVIPGKVIPPPLRQVIVERLPKTFAKPQEIIIERWLNYARRTRNVIFIPAEPIKQAKPQKNFLIEWDRPDVDLQKSYNFLGVEEVDPISYTARYGATLLDASQLPSDISHFHTPTNEVLAINSNSNEVPKLTGDVEFLKYINLTCHGLKEYVSNV